MCPEKETPWSHVRALWECREVGNAPEGIFWYLIITLDGRVPLRAGDQTALLVSAFFPRQRGASKGLGPRQGSAVPHVVSQTSPARNFTSRSGLGAWAQGLALCAQEVSGRTHSLVGNVAVTHGAVPAPRGLLLLGHGACREHAVADETRDWDWNGPPGPRVPGWPSRTTGSGRACQAHGSRKGPLGSAVI